MRLYFVLIENVAKERQTHVATPSTIVGRESRPAEANQFWPEIRAIMGRAEAAPRQYSIKGVHDI